MVKFFSITDQIKVTKLDSARRQLRTATRLWFDEGDPVAIHILAYAAHEIIHRLFRNAGHKHLMFDSPLIKDARELKKEANFLKHAERESKPDDFIMLHPGINELFIMVAVIGLVHLQQRLGDEEINFLMWQYFHTPGWFDPNIKIFSDDIEPYARDQLGKIERTAFFDICNAFRSRYLEQIR
jgi:hypothetical protein